MLTTFVDQVDLHQVELHSVTDVSVIDCHDKLYMKLTDIYQIVNLQFQLTSLKRVGVSKLLLVELPNYFE